MKRNRGFRRSYPIGRTWRFVTVWGVFLTAFLAADPQAFASFQAELLGDIYAGSSSSNPAWLTEMNGLVYFGASDGCSRSVWGSDGTSGGTLLAKDTGNQWSSFASYLAVAGGVLHFDSRLSSSGTNYWARWGVRHVSLCGQGHASQNRTNRYSYLRNTIERTMII